MRLACDCVPAQFTLLGHIGIELRKEPELIQLLNFINGRTEPNRACRLTKMNRNWSPRGNHFRYAVQSVRVPAALHKLFINCICDFRIGTHRISRDYLLKSITSPCGRLYCIILGAKSVILICYDLYCTNHSQYNEVLNMHLCMRYCNKRIFASSSFEPAYINTCR